MDAVVVALRRKGVLVGSKELWESRSNSAFLRVSNSNTTIFNARHAFRAGHAVLNESLDNGK